MPYDCGWTCSGKGEAPCRSAEGLWAAAAAVFGSGDGVGAVKDVPAATSVAGSRKSSSASRISVDRDTTTAASSHGHRVGPHSPPLALSAWITISFFWMSERRGRHRP